MGSRVPVEFKNWPPDLDVVFGPFRAVVRHHVDADTADYLVDLGMNRYDYRPVRLLSVDCPEINRTESREAGFAALAYVRSVMPIGCRVRLHTRPDPDSFGRYLARVELANGEDLASLIIAAGHGAPRPA